MESSILNYLLQQGVAIVILALGGYFLVKYFMNQIDKKDIQYREEILVKDKQNQYNLDRFIGLVEKNSEIIGKFSNSLDGLHPKLNDMHEDIKYLKNK